MPTRKLTAQVIPGLKAQGREVIFRDTIVRGLCIEVQPGGTKTFTVWTRVKGTGLLRHVTLGRWAVGVFELADARTAAREVLRDAALGKDPVLERKRAKAAGTFSQLADSFLDDVKGKMRQRTYDEWARLLRHADLEPLRKMQTLLVTRGDLIRLFDKIRKASTDSGGRGIMANRNLEVVRRVFNWAVEKDLIVVSPCFRVKKPTTDEKERTTYYDGDQLGRIVRAMNDSPFDAAIRLCLLTGVRLHTALDAPWKEMHLDDVDDAGQPVPPFWSVDGKRAGTKNGLPWHVPLSPLAVDLVRSRPAGKFVFGTRDRDGEEVPACRNSAAVRRIREQSGVQEFTPHDFRRTLNNWLTSAPGGAVRFEVRDAILGHYKKGLEKNYNQHEYEDEKREALERWARHVERVATNGPCRVLAMPTV